MSEIEFESRLAAVDVQIAGLTAQLHRLNAYASKHGEWFPAPVLHGIAVVQAALAMRLRVQDLNNQEDVVAHHGRIWNAALRALSAVPTTWNLAPPAVSRTYAELRWGLEPWLRRWSLQALPALKAASLENRS